jgi:hypothetical protein
MRGKAVQKKHRTKVLRTNPPPRETEIMALGYKSHPAKGG